MDKEYLGNGIYVEFDGAALKLTNYKGHQILLEPPEYANLEAYVNKHWRHSGE